MPTTTARIYQSTGLQANVASIAARELGISSDTEQPVIGSTVGGAKLLGTEELVTITVAAPAAIPMRRRSMTTIVADTATAGAGISLDIQAGAEVAGYMARVVVTGPVARWAIVTYGSGLVDYIPAGSSRQYIWLGAVWAVLDTPSTLPVGARVESDIELIQTAKNAFISRQTTKDVTASQAPLLVAALLTQKATFLGTSNWTGTVVGNRITFAADADWMLTALVEQAKVCNWFFTNQAATAPATPKYDYAGNELYINIAGVDYVTSNVSTGSRYIDTVASPPAGSQTAIIYGYRIGPSTIRLRRLSGFVSAAVDDVDGQYAAGLQRMDRLELHWHESYGANNSTQGGGATGLAGTSTFLEAETYVRAPKYDTVNALRTGKTTDPRASGVYVYTFAGILLSAV